MRGKVKRGNKKALEGGRSKTAAAGLLDTACMNDATDKAPSDGSDAEDGMFGLSARLRLLTRLGEEEDVVLPVGPDSSDGIHYCRFPSLRRRVCGGS
jgi:hypothetical protein